MPEHLWLSVSASETSKDPRGARFDTAPLWVDFVTLSGAFFRALAFVAAVAFLLVMSAPGCVFRMLYPVVFLILPVTIVFAFYPGLAGLHLTSGG